MIFEGVYNQDSKKQLSLYDKVVDIMVRIKEIELNNIDELFNAYKDYSICANINDCICVYALKNKDSYIYIKNNLDIKYGEIFAHCINETKRFNVPDDLVHIEGNDVVVDYSILSDCLSHKDNSIKFKMNCTQQGEFTLFFEGKIAELFFYDLGKAINNDISSLKICKHCNKIFVGRGNQLFCDNCKPLEGAIYNERRKSNERRLLNKKIYDRGYKRLDIKFFEAIYNDRINDLKKNLSIDELRTLNDLDDKILNVYRQYEKLFGSKGMFEWETTFNKECPSQGLTISKLMGYISKKEKKINKYISHK